MLFRSNMFRWLQVSVALAVVAAPVSAAGQQDGAQALADELRSLYRTQATDGALSFPGPLQFYARHPVVASLSLDAHRAQPNAALVSQSASAVSRYYDYLFGARDRDHDLLVETTLTGPHGDLVEAEEMGFNSLLALDMISLAQLNLEMRRPYRALYWYAGARSVQDAVVYAGLDADAGYFFPTGADNDQSLKQYYALAVTPMLFPGLVGDNHAGAMVREHLLKPVGRVPESAYDYLGGPTPELTDDVSASDRLLKSLVMLRVLESRGFLDDASTYRPQLASRARADFMLLPEGEAPSAHHAHLVELLEGPDAGALHQPTAAFDVFVALIRSTRAMEDNKIVRLESSVNNLRDFLGKPERDVTASDANAARSAVVAAYMAVSTVREKLEDKSLFPSKAYRSTGGIDPLRAMTRVVDDVTIALRDADNRLFRHRFRESGLYVRATLLRDRTIAGSEIDVKWTIGTHNEPITIHEASVSVGSQSSLLVETQNPLALAPGAPQNLSSRFTIDQEHIDTFAPVMLTLDLDVGDGARARYHAMRTVYVEHPVDVSAAFPSGRKLAAGTLPISVVITKKVAAPATVQYEWYSPTGLALAEGRSAQYMMQAQEDTASLSLNVIIPPECRPGRFPFKLGFYANGADLGVISSNLFKPYQWVFAGPFAAPSDPMSAEFPPQRGVRVLDKYEGPGGAIAWAAIGDGVYNDHGEISFRGLLTSPGVGFLHTVIKTGYNATLPVFMSSTAPAELFVDGKSILRLSASDSATPTYARLPLTSGVNNVLIKVAGDASTRLFFNLGDENNEASYAFNNNLDEILDGYTALVRRGRGEYAVQRDAQKLVTLRYRDPGAQAVAVIGTFNGWSPDHSRMRRASDGHWEIVLSLPPGRYSYRFLVNERQQILDPNSQDIEPDGFGGENSVMVVE